MAWCYQLASHTQTHFLSFSFPLHKRWNDETKWHKNPFFGEPFEVHYHRRNWTADWNDNKIRNHTHNTHSSNSITFWFEKFFFFFFGFTLPEYFGPSSIILLAIFIPFVSWRFILIKLVLDTDNCTVSIFGFFLFFCFRCERRAKELFVKEKKWIRPRVPVCLRYSGSRKLNYRQYSESGAVDDDDRVFFHTHAYKTSHTNTLSRTHDDSNNNNGIDDDYDGNNKNRKIILKKYTTLYLLCIGMCVCARRSTSVCDGCM